MLSRGPFEVRNPWASASKTAVAMWCMVLLGASWLSGQEEPQEQPPVVRLQLVEGGWTCRGCVRTNPILTLGDTAASALGPTALESAHSVALDGSGSYWVAQINSFRIFDPNGRLVSEVGREGEGPGEFGSRPGPAFTDYDGNIHIVDNRNGRESVYNPERQLIEEYRLVAFVRTAVAMPAAGLRVVNANLRTSAYVGIPLHLVRDNSVVTSFGEPEGEQVVRDVDLRRRVGTDERGRILSAKLYDYTIAWWDSSGRRLKTLQGPSINDGPVPSGYWTIDFGPPSKIVDLRVDTLGHLWTMRREASPSWRSQLEEEVTLPSGSVVPRLRNGDPNTVFDTHLDVIDTRTGRVLATATASGAWAGFLGSGLAWQPRITDSGVPYVTIWRFER